MSDYSNLPRSHVRSHNDKLVRARQLNELKTLASCVNDDKRMKVDVEDITGSGLSTEAKQDDMISLLEGQTPALNRPKAIPVQIMVGDAGGSYDALRANGQDLLVMVDDMNPDVAVNSGLATKAEQQTANTSLNNIDTKVATSAKQDTMISLLEGQTPALNRTKAIPVQIMVGDAGGNYDALRANGQDLLVKVDDMDPDVAVNSGLATKAEQQTANTSLNNIDNSTASIDGKLAKSVVVGSDGTTSAQIVMACGTNDGTNLRTIATNDNGDVRSLLVGTDNGGTTHEVKTSNTGNLIMEVEHSWDTETLLSTTTLTAGSDTTTNTLDLGQGVSHELDDVTFFVDNSNTSVSISIEPQSSPDGTNWYVSGAGTSVSTTEAKSFISSDNSLNFGHANRYMRLRIVNKDASLSTDVSAQSGRYK